MSAFAARLERWRQVDNLAYLSLLMLGVLDAAGYSLIAPTLPAIAEQAEIGPALAGVLVASFPAAMTLGFALGGVAVKRGRIAVLLRTSLALVIAGSLAFIVGNGFGAYLAGRMVMGLGSGGLWIGLTFATLARWPGCEYLCMSRVFAAYSVGGLLGPTLGALGGVRVPFAVYAALVAAGLLLVRVLDRSPTQIVHASDRAALRLHGFWVAAAGILFAVLALGVVEGVLPLHFAERLSQGEIGALYVGMSLVAATAAAAAGSLPARPILLGSTILVVLGLAVAGATATIPVWLLALLLAGCGIGLANTGSLGVLIETVKTDRIVTAMVVWSQIGILGYLLGPLTGGPLSESLGYAAVAVVPAMAAALVVALSLVPTPQRGRVAKS